MRIGDCISSDAEEWLGPVANEYERQWKRDADEDLLLFASCGGYSELDIVVDEDELSRASKQCKKRDRLDNYGLCIRALELPVGLCAPLCKVLSGMLSHDVLMSQLGLSGTVKGKERGIVGVEETRGLAAQPCLLELASRVMISRVQEPLDVWSKREGLVGFVMGCGKGAQTRDVSWNLSQALEKGRDRHNDAAVASGDIEKCHDRLAWSAAIRGFLRRGISLSHAAAIFRIMRCPVLQLRVGSCSTRPLERTRSALTGNPLASCIARISVEDSLSLARHEFRSSFELQESMCLDAQSWSDNLACIAQTPEAAAANLARWGQYLFTVFHMKLKPSSMIIVPARTRKAGESELVVGERWRVVDKEKVLGSWLTSTGEDRSERASVMSAWNIIYWKNCTFVD